MNEKNYKNYRKQINNFNKNSNCEAVQISNNQTRESQSLTVFEQTLVYTKAVDLQRFAHNEALCFFSQKTLPIPFRAKSAQCRYCQSPVFI